MLLSASYGERAAKGRSPGRRRTCESPQRGVFRTCFADDWEREVGLVPQLKQFFVRPLRLADITAHRPGPRELQPRESSHRILEHDARVVENLLEFRGRLRRLAQGDIRHAANIGWI